MSRVNKVNYAYRRTIEFLSSGRIHLKNNVRVIHIKYTTHADSSVGTRLRIILYPRAVIGKLQVVCGGRGTQITVQESIRADTHQQK